MKHLRKNWHWFVVTMALIVGGAVGWSFRGAQGAVALLQLPGGYTALDEAQHDELLNLLEDVSLPKKSPGRAFCAAWGPFTV